MLGGHGWETPDTRQLCRALEELVAIAIQMADALSAAHAQGILHRDITPANVMIDRRGQARVMDFGLASSPGQGVRLTSTPSVA